ncbi:MAG: branched-chain amino acid ABC transporter permease [Armatimonadota bacterium]|nr:branched-chain amino acid ABC transporter permease [Armatimonadota bacterium]MDR7443119.1 branched-chain amino acid ABC transporter permease [Armatimonadota bacterium]MDR7569610.1 branched-chain amino acid ABC transporter permease [Armatimonadota bacterium]MDR7614664.1 branched-chain amino acid ABC transporter permease [Armatimonadota bacterium]
MVETKGLVGSLIRSGTTLRTAALVAVAAALVGAPWYLPAYSLVFLSNLGMYVVLTVSWMLFAGTTGYISLASAVFFGLGVYAAVLWRTSLGFWTAVLLGGLISSAAAAGMGVVTLRLRGAYFSMFTLGAVELATSATRWGEAHFFGRVGRIVLPVGQEVIYYAMLALLGLLFAAWELVQRSKLGMALRCIGEDEEAAAHIGIPTTRVKVVGFSLSAVFMGCAGAIMATRWTYVDPRIAFNLQLSFIPVLIAVFTGSRRPYGAALGAVLFVALEDFLITRLPYHYMLLFGLVMVAVMLYSPGGVTAFVSRWWEQVLAWAGGRGGR